MKRASKEESWEEKSKIRRAREMVKRRMSICMYLHLHLIFKLMNSGFLSCCEIISVRNGTRVTRLGKPLSRFSNDVVNIVV